MRNFLFFFLATVLLVAPALAASKRTEGIAAVVGNAAITQSDLDDRLRMIMSSAGLPNTPDVLARVRPQILSTLVEEQIKRAEAGRLGLKIEAKDIETALAEIARQNNMTPEQFRAMFKSRGLPLRSITSQITAQIAWMKVVGRKIRPQVEVSESEIDIELETLQTKLGQTEYRLAEIILPVDRPQDEKNAKELAQKIQAQIRKDPAAFPALAQQFSRGSSAAQGGDIGWVSKDQLDSALAQDIINAKAGTVIGPHKTAMGLTLLLVRDQRVRTADTLPDRDTIANRIGIERLDRLQRRYYSDLRASSFVDIRL